MIKRILPVLAVMLAFTFAFAPVDANAKKFGGSKSFGKSFNTAPSQPSAFKSPSSSANKSTNQSGANSAKKKGLLGGLAGGLLGGLLVGGLLSSLMGGGAFEGIQFMDILLMAGLAFIAFKIFKSMSRAKASAINGGPSAKTWQATGPLSSTPGAGIPASDWKNEGTSFRKESTPLKDAEFGSSAFRGQTNDNATPAAANTGFGPSTTDVPLNLPDGFDLTGFLTRSRDHYRSIQDAWNSGDMEKIREYVSPELFTHLQQERTALTGDQHTEVMYVDAEVVRADNMYGKTELSLKFSGRYRDNVERVEENITDIWHLEQANTQAPWLIIGIEYSEE